MSLKILLADDHPVIAAAVRDRLQTQTGWDVCGEVTTAADLLNGVEILRPDIVITDYHMPGLGENDGLAARQPAAAASHAWRSGPDHDYQPPDPAGNPEHAGARRTRRFQSSSR